METREYRPFDQSARGREDQKALSRLRKTLPNYAQLAEIRGDDRSAAAYRAAARALDELAPSLTACRGG